MTPSRQSVYDHAVSTLGSKEKAERWLRKPSGALGGKVPLDMLDTDAGAWEVECVLSRLNHGIPS